MGFLIVSLRPKHTKGDRGIPGPLHPIHEKALDRAYRSIARYIMKDKEGLAITWLFLELAAAGQVDAGILQSTPVDRLVEKGSI